MATGILGEICRERAADAAAARRARPAASLERRAGAPRPCFAAAAALAASRGGATPCGEAALRGAGLLIAECKKASPSRGLIAPDYDPVPLARAYERGGAGMVSVLTEPRHFLGSDGHLSAVRDAVALPVLRKDFVVDEYQLAEAWAIGADAALLIVAALEKARLFELAARGRELGLSLLIETRDEAEIEVAMELASALATSAEGGDHSSRNAATGAIAIGVNARDLRDFSVDHGRAASLASLLADGPFSVAESGLKRPEEAAALAAAGFRGFLVGEALSSAIDPEAATRAFVAAIGGAVLAAEGGAAGAAAAAPRGTAGTAP